MGPAKSPTHIAIAALFAGCASGCILGPPDTFRDMEARMGDFSLPQSAVLIAKRRDGLRSGFAAASPPSLHYTYSIPWVEGDPCENLPEVDENVVIENTTTGDGGCAVQGRISSGFRAKLVHVGQYGLVVVAESPEQVASRAEGVDCNEITSQGLSPWVRYHVECWAPPGHGLLWITLHGKTGW